MSGAAAAAGGGGAAPTNYRAMYRAMTTPALVSEAWETVDDLKLRDQIHMTMRTREMEGDPDAWPSAAMAARDEMAGLYPDPADPQFAARLFGKKEFYDARAVAAGVAAGDIDPCSSAAAEKVFELTPVQRIVSRFMHPLTPYMGCLIHHGVGVGKTCTAVTIAEQFLEMSPNLKVIVLVPQALKENFKRTVFDPTKLSWNEAEGHWTSHQCTGTSYLERLELMEEPDLRVVTNKIENDRHGRYTITGYQAFANWIQRTLDSNLPRGLTDPVAREAAENEVLRRIFSDRLIIIDEAHNLRDTAVDSGAAAAGDADPAAAGAGEEAAENKAGKALNPFLRRIVLNAEGLRLVLMTATPMYNSAPEIVLLLNYLLLNDTKNEKTALKVNTLFTRDGDLIPGKPAAILERIARRYVTFMRGENPFTFPLRMRPLEAEADAVAAWPTVSASRAPVVFTAEETAAVNAMPLIFTEPVPGSPVEALLRAGTTRAAQTEAVAAERAAATAAGAKGPTDAMLDARIQIGNLTYPNSLYGVRGWDNYFLPERFQAGDNKITVFSPRAQPEGDFDIDSVFAGEGLRTHAPKIHTIVEHVKAAQGICFAYSRYIKAGALPLAAALERAGFQRRMADGSLVPLLKDVPPVAPICAICGRVEHAAGDHPFRPACYVVLTSDPTISPKFSGLVQQAATWPTDPEWGALGAQVKVVIGSQVASEGLDLKCVREMHILDAWYHLNRTEQIIGRAIRYCSHTALRAVERRMGLPAMALNNCLIYLHALRVSGTAAAPDSGYETADMYAYRIAIGKALMVGRVQRLLKKHAWDCNLELEAIVFTGLPPRTQIDAQGNDRKSRGEDGAELDGYSINDQDYTTYCDYQACAHQCAVAVARTEAEGLHVDVSTYSVSDARRLVLSKQTVVRRLFDDQVMVPEAIVRDIFGDLPWEIASEALLELLDGRKFRLRRPDGVEGFLVAKGGYIVFQPARVTVSDIPMTMRYSRAFQLRRRFMEPSLPVFARAEEARVALAMAASAAVPGGGDSEVASAPPPPQGPPKILEEWEAWAAYVSTRGAAGLPPGFASQVNTWRWILTHFSEVPEATYAALRWWYDRVPTLEAQQVLMENAIERGVNADASPELAMLASTLKEDIFRSAQTVAYRVYDVATMETKYFCRSASAAGGVQFNPCSSAIAGLVERTLSKPPVEIPGSMGPLFGFMAPKTGKIVFKTMDTTKALTRKAVGAECGNVSNMGEHRARVVALQEAAGASDLAPLMLPSADEEWDDEKTGRRRMQAFAPTHVKDFSHQPMCIYMEFLCRLLDARRVVEKRWFLSAAVAAGAGLKGRA
jgi:hypothetical protein